jgi:predicted RNA-binding protein with PUA-like domain
MPERARRYWLMKSEPEVFSFDDLWAQEGRRTFWDGLRDDMKKGDGILFYHSNADPPGVAGLAEVVREGHSDASAFDPRDPHFDSRSDPEAPRWYGVDIRATRRLKALVSLAALKANRKLASMALVQRGQRLSVQPVTRVEWVEVCRMGGVPPD